jgi:hypothetical protein
LAARETVYFKANLARGNEFATGKKEKAAVMIDLRSDTVTRPTPEMRAAMVAA